MSKQKDNKEPQAKILTINSYMKQNLINVVEDSRSA